MSRVMIRNGDTTPVEGRGLDLISNAIIDQHFLARNRLWRLEQMLSTHPGLIGLGVDESTALVIRYKDWNMSVVGDSYVCTCIPVAGSTIPRIEFLKQGDSISLADLRQNHLAYVAPKDE